MGVKFYPRIQVRGMVHSKNTVEEITLIESLGGNKYIVLTKDGVMCSAIFNIFTRLYYADDLYGVIEDQTKDQAKDTRKDYEYYGND